MFDSPRASQVETVEKNPGAYDTMQPGEFPSIRRKFEEIEDDIRGEDPTKLTADKTNSRNSRSNLHKTMSFKTPKIKDINNQTF